MLFDTVEFLSDQSKIVNPKIEQTLPQTAESTVTLQDVNNAVAAAAVYDIGGFSQGKPDASSSMFRLVAPRAFTLPANLAGSIAKAGTAATASTVFIIKKNGTQIGSMTFAASSSTGAFTFASQVSVAVGDIIDLVAPATQDATLSDVSVTIAATLA